MPMTDNWLNNWFKARDVALWGVADLSEFTGDETVPPYRHGVAFAVPMDKGVMAAIKKGPNRPYADEYVRVNDLIDAIGEELAGALEGRGHNALHLAASKRTDPLKIAGAFPHKTVATRAGLGWVGKCCQLVTRRHGPWVRLGSVFTDAPLIVAKPVVRSFCGSCRECVDACPAEAINGAEWSAGVGREALLDARVCDEYKKRHFYEFHQGHNCNICGAACPYGLKSLKP
ncbi:MAG: epoxyqueuosine reductase [Deltaproteobacteria bacterium]|nr:MAG: epoxyqueuosine reductase [Deltaproteobacteria bacterium]